MMEFVDCRTCKRDCVRADGNYGYTFCDKYTHPPITNADRIRSMSDEDLAELIVVRIKDIHHKGMRELAYSAWLEWLQKPAE